jgi:hypothetical protein
MILSYHKKTQHNLLFLKINHQQFIHYLPTQHNTKTEHTSHKPQTLPLMENCLRHHHLTLKPHIGFFTTPISSSSLNFRSRVPFNSNNKLKLIIKASAGASHCEYSSLNSPLLPRSQVGKFLSGVLQNHRSLFHVAVQEELKLLSDDRDAAVSRMILASHSDQALLHRFLFFFLLCFFL